MLIARVLTALVLAPAVVAGIVLLPAWPMQAVFGVVVALAALEWAALADLAPVGRAVYAGATVVVMTAVWFAAVKTGLLDVLLTAAAVWWVGVAVWIAMLQVREGPRVAHRLSVLALGWLALVPAWCAVSALLVRWPVMLVACFALVWAADSFAYFGGRAFGRRRLASRISPGKTWEGVFAALAGTLALAAIAAFVWRPAHPALLLAVVTASVVLSVAGDLLESLLKRSHGVKDSGTLLPGHGGVLDRIDSTLAAAPVFAAGVSHLQP